MPRIETILGNCQGKVAYQVATFIFAKWFSYFLYLFVGEKILAHSVELGSVKHKVE